MCPSFFLVDFQKDLIYDFVEVLFLVCGLMAGLLRI